MTEKRFGDKILLLSVSVTPSTPPKPGEKMIRTKNFVVGSVCHTSAGKSKKNPRLNFVVDGFTGALKNYEQILNMPVMTAAMDSREKIPRLKLLSLCESKKPRLNYVSVRHTVGN